MVSLAIIFWFDEINPLRRYDDLDIVVGEEPTEVLIVHDRCWKYEYEGFAQFFHACHHFL